MRLRIKIVVSMLVSGLFNGVVASEKEAALFAFPDKYMLRLGAYFINDTNTKVVLNPTGSALGTLIDFNRDLGGESRQTIPGIDAYYWFNERHRVDFTVFRVSRDAAKTFIVDINIVDKLF